MSNFPMSGQGGICENAVYLEVITVKVDPQVDTDPYSDSPVFRGTLQEPRLYTSNPGVALKFAMRDDLIDDLVEEAKMYTGPLAPLQGSTCPRNYGLYVGAIDDGLSIGCLVLEYWGQVLPMPFHCLPLELRVRILERLGEIHRQGLLHGDFAERNVLEKDGDIKLIDFDKAIPGHHCSCDMNFHAGEQAPDRESFGCDELWDVCKNVMQLWK
ncbi:hypothetical protein CPB84DRAFT_353450 [Gymnopilus junonius]|uniref:Uncharacterized protein n=1 Tax=Gymnopilus junonius TaxID=109634 RepID=A0A9P5NBM2_GYMJU|nr:hypothetical protein CPB84DRAFT_353450 [Gymnopilus junonius]